MMLLVHNETLPNRDMIQFQQKDMEASNIRVVDSQIEHASVENQLSDHVICIVEETDKSISTSATTLNTSRFTANNHSDSSVDESCISGGDPQEVKSLSLDGKSNQYNQELEI